MPVSRKPLPLDANDGRRTRREANVAETQGTNFDRRSNASSFER